MFERMTQRVARIAEQRRERLRGAAAARLAEGVPAGIAVEAVEEGVLLSGRGLRRRMAREPELRTIVAVLR